MNVIRSLLRQPTYVALSLATLALAVGANLVVFSVVNALWLRPRPVTDPDRVVMVMADTGSTGSSETFFFAELGLQRWVRDVPAFARVAGQVMTSGTHAALMPRIVLDPVGRPLETLGVTSEYFSVLGLAVHGRDFNRDDDRYSGQPVAIISDRIWKDVFGGGDEVIGRVVAASPMPIRIIGVAPAGFTGARLGERADLWIPRNLVPRVSGIGASGVPPVPEGSIGVLPIARLQPWITQAEAQRLLNEHVAQLGRNAMTHLAVVPLASIFGTPDHRTLLVNEKPVLRVIALTALLVLVGGCATLMAIVLVHYERRRQEFAIRLALGASRRQLVGRLARELGWMAAAGSGAALGVAGCGIGGLPALSLPGGVDLGRLDLTLDWRVALTGVTASSLTMAMAACIPLARFTHGSVASGIVTPIATASCESLRLRKVMLGVHVGATVVVLVAAGLFVRSIQYGFARGAGFDVDGTAFITADVGTPWDLSARIMAERAPGGTASGSADREAQRDAILADLEAQRRTLSQRIIDLLAGLPGVDSLAIGPAPVGADQAAEIARPKFLQTNEGRRDMRVGLLGIGPEYVRALGLRVLAGRNLSQADVRPWESLAPVLISQSLATAIWPGRSPLGQHVRLGYSLPGTEYEVIGIVDDFAFGSIRFDPPATMVRAVSSPSANSLKLAIRSRNPLTLAAPVRRLLAGIVAEGSITIATGREVVAADLGRERLSAWFFSGFGIVALALGVGGVFGLIAYLAESRRRELGIRLALGAAPADLLRLALGSGLVPAAIGVSAGLLAAGILTKTAESFLLGIHRLDWLTYGVAAALMLGSAAAAGLAAAWRVRQISPVEALRAEG